MKTICYGHFPFRPIWAKCGLACFCLRHPGRPEWEHAGRGEEEMCGGGGSGVSRARHLTRKFLTKRRRRRRRKKIKEIIPFLANYLIQSDKEILPPSFGLRQLHFCGAYHRGFPIAAKRGAGGSCSAPPTLPTPPPCLSPILWQTAPAAPAHTPASNISNALGEKAMWSCPSLPA